MTKLNTDAGMTFARRLDMVKTNFDLIRQMHGMADRGIVAANMFEMMQLMVELLERGSLGLEEPPPRPPPSEPFRKG